MKEKVKDPKTDSQLPLPEIYTNTVPHFFLYIYLRF